MLLFPQIHQWPLHCPWLRKVGIYHGGGKDFIYFIRGDYDDYGYGNDVDDANNNDESFWKQLKMNPDTRTKDYGVHNMNGMMTLKNAADDDVDADDAAADVADAYDDADTSSKLQIQRHKGQRWILPGKTS